jgi:prepilin-type processing-associated H-X9-DG protein
MFRVKIVRPDSANPRVLPRLFASIAEAASFTPHSGRVVSIVYADGRLARRVA